MSSPYVILKKRPLDQWKVAELKEELKKRKLTIKGLKEDLVKRLDEAVRAEWETAGESTDKNLNEERESEIPAEQEITGSVVSGRVKELLDSGRDAVGILDRNTLANVDDVKGSLDEGRATKVNIEGINGVGFDVEQADEFTTVETTVVVHDTIEPVTFLSGSKPHRHRIEDDGDLTGRLDHDGVGSQDCFTHELSDPNAHLPKLKESCTPLSPSSGLSLLDSEIHSEAVHLMDHLQNDNSAFLHPDHNVQPLDYQVSGVDHPDLQSQVVADPVSTESVSLIDNNEVKVVSIIDNAKLEINVDSKTLHSPPTSFARPENVEEKTYVEEIDPSNIENVDNIKNIFDDMGPEKISLDRSSGDDSMEEDALESKEMDYKSDTFQSVDTVGKTDLNDVEEDSIVDVVGVDKRVETSSAKVENYMDSSSMSVKRKFNSNDEEAVRNNAVSKRLRRLTVEGPKGSESQSGTFLTPTTLKDSIQDPQISVKRLNRSDTMLDEVPKERHVPPPSKPPSNSLRIYRFLRPFTLKAVQELLGKTGMVTSFWMDHIKTHCYVSYSSMEEAVETRNAVYNLQWPPNGGRMLVAEFVEPEDVKTRVEAPAASLMSPSSGLVPNFFTAQPTMQTQPSPRLQFPRKQPPAPLLPPPPLVNVPTVRERSLPTNEHLPRELLLPVEEHPNLPPPAPLSEKIDPPIVTLDDLFRKTNATPRIYYLPLSEEQVSAKLKAHGKNV